MSFYCEFHAKDLEAAINKIEDDKNIPDCIKAFVYQALGAMQGDFAIRVKVAGHLSSRELSSSNVLVEVVPIVFAKPRHASP